MEKNDTSDQVVHDIEAAVDYYKSKSTAREDRWKTYCRTILNDEEFALMFPNG